VISVAYAAPHRSHHLEGLTDGTGGERRAEGPGRAHRILGIPPVDSRLDRPASHPPSFG
jgi:hypothetical protein